MHMAKSLIAAALLALALVGAVVVPTAVTRGTFAFHAWPKAPGSHARDEQVALVESSPVRKPVRHERPGAAPKVVAGAPSAEAADSLASADEVARVSTPASTPRSSHPKPPQQQQSSSSDPAPDQAPAPSPSPTPGDDEVAEGDQSDGGSAQVEARPVVNEPPLPGASQPASHGAPADESDEHSGEDSDDHSEEGSEAHTPHVGIAPPPGWVHAPWRHHPGRGHNDGKN
jgi:hypothetical protein